MQKRVYEIDGKNFSSLEEFYDEISEVLIPGRFWGRNLDAFNDILRGGFGTPDEGFVLNWKNSELSRVRLGYIRVNKHFDKRLPRRQDGFIEKNEWEHELEKHQLDGPTVFELLIEIINIHCPGGEEEEDDVELILD